MMGDSDAVIKEKEDNSMHLNYDGYQLRGCKDNYRILGKAEKCTVTLRQHHITKDNSFGGLHLQKWPMLSVIENIFDADSHFVVIWTVRAARCTILDN